MTQPTYHAVALADILHSRARANRSWTMAHLAAKCADYTAKIDGTESHSAQAALATMQALLNIAQMHDDEAAHVTMNMLGKRLR